MIHVNSKGEAFASSTDYRDTVYDSLAASNRTARATFQAVKQLQDLVVYALILLGISLLVRNH